MVTNTYMPYLCNSIYKFVCMYQSGLDEGLTRVDNCTTVRSLGSYHEWEGSGGGIISVVE